MGSSRIYGNSSELYFIQKPMSDAFLLGGIAEDSSRWTRVLSQRAAQLLWLHLMRVFDIEHLGRGITGFGTAPLRSTALPTITNHFNIHRLSATEFEIIGWVGDCNWIIYVSESEARRLFSAMHKLFVTYDTNY